MSVNHAPTRCAFHADQDAVVACRTCSRPICADCLGLAAGTPVCPVCLMTAVHEPAPRWPRATSLAIIGVNVAVWLLIMLTGWQNSPWIFRLAQSDVGICADPLRGLYWPVGATECPTVGGFWFPGVASGAWWQVITAAFTHVDAWHIGFNMFALYQLGPAVEAPLGRLRFLLIYLGSALTGAAVVATLATPGSWTLGASGAIFGLMAAVLVLALVTKGNVRTIAVWIGINAVLTIVGGAFISWQGHLGGFLGGLLLTWLMVRMMGRRTRA